MSDKDIYGQFALQLLNNISPIYWGKMWDYIENNKIKHNHLTGFLMNPEKIVISIGNHHIALEYYGFEKIEKLNGSFRLSIEVNDYSKESEGNFLEKVIGTNFDSSLEISFELPSLCEGLMVPTNRALDKLVDLGWNFDTIFHSTSINSSWKVKKRSFTRLINCIFFDENKGSLVTRRVKWMDFIPLNIDTDINDIYDEFRFDLSHYYNNWLADLTYKYPYPYKFKDVKVNIMNKFIELIGDKSNNEPKITSFLEQAENQFILTMGFFCVKVMHQVKCVWQSEQRDNIIPDFFIVKPNGFADIVEFKLPDLKSNIVVGRNNREKFSSEINSYIAQTRVYAYYFEDPNNRIWFENNYGFKVYKPRRYIVVGRRYDFSSTVWHEIKSEFSDVEIVTFDDLIDGVFTQLYM